MRAKLLARKVALEAHPAGGGARGVQASLDHASQSRLASAMTMALSDADLPLHKVWANPQRAVLLKQLRHRVSLHWKNAGLSRAFKQWADAKASESKRAEARMRADAAAAEGSWKARFMQGPLPHRASDPLSRRLSHSIAAALSCSSAPALVHTCVRVCACVCVCVCVRACVCLTPACPCTC